MFKKFFENPLKQKSKTLGLQPSYIKDDGTKVYEKDESYGHVVNEVCPDGAFLSNIFSEKGRIISSYARQKNLEIGSFYDEFGKEVYKFESVYDEHKKLAIKKEYNYEYYDNGKMKSETFKTFPEEVFVITNFDESGEKIEKIEKRGSVTTWFDKNDKPIKREIDRGSGGIITEDLQGQ